MSNDAINISNISKKYLIHHKPNDGSIRGLLSNKLDVFTSYISRSCGATDISANSFQSSEEFWALKNISLSIKHGERVGIIGRNGAGKSTLLKVLSRITSPSQGIVTLNGSVSSLLEVGTGFHPDLSGRENIYLNGAILGMGRNEIKRKFDQIVDFAGVEKFLDTPVKRYSSGMYVRLAFAVAAHLESEILIVDEVLAVGDAEFQKKCLGRMEAISKSGRTILFVSHNMGAVTEICSRVVLMEAGGVLMDGAPAQVLSKYLATSSSARVVVEKIPNSSLNVIEISILDMGGRLASSIELGSNAKIQFKFTVEHQVKELTLAIEISRNGSPILYSYNHDLDGSQLEKIFEPGEYLAEILMPLSIMKEGNYEAMIKVGVGKTNLTNELAKINFEIFNFSLNTSNKSYRADRPGCLFMPMGWTLKEIA